MRSILLSLLPIITAQTTRPPPEPCTGNCTAIHDPSLIRTKEGTWLRFSTLGNIALASSPSLTGPWTYQGAVFPNGSTITLDSNQELWAPDVFFANDLYHLYYSVSRSGAQWSEFGVATSPSGALGSWTDHGSLGIPKSAEYNIIDGNFFRECETCGVRFTYGSAWKGVYQTSLSADYLRWNQNDKPVQMVFNSSFPAHPQTYPSIVEGGYLFWWNVAGVKYYYVFFSSGACCNGKNDLEAPGDEYKIMVCRATSAEGPFLDKEGRNCASQNGGTLVLGSHGDVYAPGGQGVVVDPASGKIALYYHYANPKIGYEYAKFLFGFNYISFASGWPELTT